MSSSIFITEQSKAEIRQITNYLENVLKSKQAKDNFVEKLRHMQEILRESPELYAISRTPEVKAIEGRVAPVGNYVMIYVLKDNVVIVAHVFHRLQNYAKLL